MIKKENICFYTNGTALALPQSHLDVQVVNVHIWQGRDTPTAIYTHLTSLSLEKSHVQYSMTDLHTKCGGIFYEHLQLKNPFDAKFKIWIAWA